VSDDNPWDVVDRWAADHGLPFWYREYGRKTLNKHLRASSAKRKQMATRCLMMFDGLEVLMRPVPMAQMMERRMSLTFDITVTTTGELQLLIKVPAELKDGREIAPAMTFKHIVKRELRIAKVDHEI
jgi:hypothetical protein